MRFIGLGGKDGGADRDRTDDLHNAIVALFQLSYGPKKWFVLEDIAYRVQFKRNDPGRPQAGGGGSLPGWGGRVILKPLVLDFPFLRERVGLPGFPPGLRVGLPERPGGRVRPAAFPSEGGPGGGGATGASVSPESSSSVEAGGEGKSGTGGGAGGSSPPMEGGEGRSGTVGGAGGSSWASSS